MLLRLMWYAVVVDGFALSIVSLKVLTLRTHVPRLSHSIPVHVCTAKRRRRRLTKVLAGKDKCEVKLKVQSV